MVSLPLPSRNLHFRGEDAAADLGPCQAGDQADFALLMHLGVAEFGHAEKLADIRGGQFFLVLDAALDHLARHLAQTLPISRSRLRTPASRV